MDSADLIREHLNLSRDRVLMRVEEMREHCFVFPTPKGGGHTMWVLGHLAYIEGLVVRTFMLGEPNPLAAWEPLFDGDDVSADRTLYPPFDDVLAACRGARASTLALLETWSEADLDQPSARIPKGFEEAFGTRRRCLH